MFWEALVLEADGRAEARLYCRLIRASSVASMESASVSWVGLFGVGESRSGSESSIMALESGRFGRECSADVLLHVSAMAIKLSDLIWRDIQGYDRYSLACWLEHLNSLGISG